MSLAITVVASGNPIPELNGVPYLLELRHDFDLTPSTIRVVIVLTKSCNTMVPEYLQDCKWS